MLSIRYETESFPPNTVANGSGNLSVSWDDILWSAITIGRPNLRYVFKHGHPSAYEAIFRLSLVRMALEQRSASSRRLHRTMCYRVLDPSEKGTIGYFLGMTFCKLFADKLLNTPWLLHLDVFRPVLNPVLRGRSRPDLVGFDAKSNEWHAFECKGRFVAPNRTDKAKAKAQAQRLISVQGLNCKLHIGAITYFQRDTLQFFWRDPPPTQGKSLELDLDPDHWRYYYAPFTALLQRTGGGSQHLAADAVFNINEPDIEIGVHPKIAPLLYTEEWQAAQRIAAESAEELEADGYQSDGLFVRAGQSWKKRFADPASS